MKLEVTVCNVCADVSRGTMSYEVRSEGRIGDADLCEEHAAPFEAVLGTPAQPAVAKPVRRASTRRNSTPILTMEEIDKRKAGQS